MSPSSIPASKKTTSARKKFPTTIVRWVGGKRQLLTEIGNLLPETGRRWIEPFAGSGIVGLAHGHRCQSQLWADYNPDLIALYRRVRDNIDDFIAEAMPVFDPANNTKDGFVALRARFNKLVPGEVERLPLFLFLNRSGHNGLVRLNLKGELNSGFGKHASVPLYVDHLLAMSKALQGIELVHADFREVMRQAGPGDIVYCDPPYLQAFKSYTQTGFSMTDQVALAFEARAASERGATVLISNTDCSVARELYAGAVCHQVEAMRYMAPKKENRGKAQEVLALYTAAVPAVLPVAVAPVVIEIAKDDVVRPLIRRRQPSMMRELEPLDAANDDWFQLMACAG